MAESRLDRDSEETRGLVTPAAPGPECDAAQRARALEAFARAISREAHNVARQPDLLWQQLHNRLQWEDGGLSEILAPERSRRSRSGAAPWLRTRLPFGESEAAERTLAGHTGPCMGCAVSRDGSFVVSASLDNTLKIWDTATGEERATLAGHTDSILGCAISPDGSFVVSASSDNTLKIWDAETGNERATLQGHGAWVRGCAVSPDGTFVVSASADWTLKVWDVATASLRATLRGHAGDVNGCAISPDGSFVVSASRDNTLKIWDVETGEERATLEGHYHWVSACAITPDGSFIVSASHDGTLKIWEAETASERVLRGPGTLAGHTDAVNACAVSPDGSFIVSASADKTLKIWDAETGAELASLLGHAFWVSACAVGPDGSFVVSAGEDGLRIWDLARIRRGGTRRDQVQMITDCAVSPDGSFVVSASDDHSLMIRDGADGTVRRTLLGHTDPVLGCAVSPDGTHIVSAGWDTTVRVWDVASGAELAVLAGHTAPVWDCAISPDGSTIVSASADKTLKIWDAATAVERATFAGHGDTVFGCAVSPDGRFVVSASWDGTLKTWDISTGAVRATLRGHTDKVWRCVVSPDGSAVVSASADNTVRVWDVASGSERLAFRGHGHSARCCAMSPDGALIASADEAGTLKVWDVATGAARAAIPLLGSVGGIALHPSSPLAVCGDLAGNVYLIDLIGIEYGPIIVTAVDGAVSCPACRRELPVEDGWLGRVVACTQPGCDGRMRVNPFVIELTKPARAPRPHSVEPRPDPSRAPGGYVQRCLEPAFVEVEEPREWDSDPTFRNVLDPLNRGDDELAVQEAEKLAARFPDLHLAYFWQGAALMSLWELDRAREVLCRGVQRSRRKFTLCARLGEVEWRAGKLVDAVYWWAQAVHCQESLDGRGNDVSAYLHLHYVAVGVEEAYAALAFLRRVDAMRAGQIRLNSGEALRELAAREGTPDIREVVRGLWTRYPR
jgi:WD40 repeat protein